jgi:hypothetical protein
MSSQEFTAALPIFTDIAGNAAGSAESRRSQQEASIYITC